MAHVDIHDQHRRLTSPQEIAEFLAPFGIHYERWDVGERVDADATNEEILAAYGPEIERLKTAGGYVTADVINVNPQTPNLETMLTKFSTEHTHSEDEVRFIVKGRGVFHIHPPGGPVFGIEMEAGDLINVPAGTQHWFDLCTDRTIRAIRLFQDTSGWTPKYIDGSEMHMRYQPVCWGPEYIGTQPTISSVVKP